MLFYSLLIYNREYETSLLVIYFYLSCFGISRDFPLTIRRQQWNTFSSYFYSVENTHLRNDLISFGLYNLYNAEFVKIYTSSLMR